ncbi:MAG: hypothetical protein JAZ13_00020 [Candidatus Thiodiazotropha taylori]|nr:hypothetical protein [Candidatus Thiodiazotropha taylori]
MNKFLIIPIIISLSILPGCGSNNEDDQAVKQPSPEELERRRIEHEKWLAEKEKIKSDLIAASDQDLKEMLSSCKQAVESEAERRNKGPFATALVHEYSADVYLFAAGASAVKSYEERIESFRKYGQEYGSINTQYAIISTSDSFSGPIKSIDKYRCEIGPELKIASVGRSY